MTRRKAIGILWIAFLMAPALTFAQIYIPYYGKNFIHYDNFKWKVYSTEHFDIYFYEAERFALPMVAGVAEEAYQRVKDIMQIDVPFRIPLIFFRNQAEFEQLSYVDISEGTLGVAESARNRMAFTIDVPAEMVRNLITHELTHIFEFAFLFGRLNNPISFQAALPGWVMEGFAQFPVGEWDPMDLMVVRDAALTDRLPYVSSSGLLAPFEQLPFRAPYTIGQATWEFVAEKFGLAGLRNLWYQYKKSSYLGSSDPFLGAFGITTEKFNESFAEYLRDRFSRYRDYETPAEYDRVFELPYPYRQIYSYALTPDGRYAAIQTGNISSLEFDIVLVDRNTGKITNLTKGYTMKFLYLTNERWGDFGGRNVTITPDGSRIAFFARTKKYRSLFIYDNSGRIIDDVYIKLNKTASPQFHADGKHISFVGMSEDNHMDIWVYNLESREMKRLTNDEIYKESPIWIENGKALLYVGRSIGRSSIYKVTYPEGEITTVFEPKDNWYILSPDLSEDGRTLVFSANVDEPLDLVRYDTQSGELVRMTKVMTGNFSTSIRTEGTGQYAYFINYFKGLYHLYRIPLTRQTETLSPPEVREGLSNIIATYSALPSLDINNDKVVNKGFRPFLASQPQLFTGATAGAFAVAGGLTLEDILGDNWLTFYVQRIRGFNTIYASWLDLGQRFQYLLEAYWNDDFFISPIVIPPNVLPSGEGFVALGLVKNSQRGADIVGYYPLDIWRRFDITVGLFRVDQKFDDPFLDNVYKQYQQDQNQVGFLQNGWLLPLTLGYTVETTRFQFFGPLSGYTGRIAVNYSIPFSGNIDSRWTIYGDFRQYLKLDQLSLLAWRVQAFHSGGNIPQLFIFGGGLSFRGFGYRELIGNTGAIVNIELRAPLLPPGPRRHIPTLNAFRFKLFADAGILDLANFFTDQALIVGSQGYNASQGIGSFGAGLTIFFAGLPINFELAWVHNFRSIDSSPHLNFSIGYDF